MSKRVIYRLIHTAGPLVGPPHPVSNLRPALYNGVPDQAKTNAYSPNELHSHLPINADKFQLDNALKQLDKLNHDFWVESNQRFHQSRHAYLEAQKYRLAHAKTSEERAAMEEEHLAEFYASWVQTMRPLQHEYTATWLRGQYGSILTAARMNWRHWMKRLNSFLG
ncbi:hypothetical protein M408DRAFT_332046 [Serendipita vermifera MAFF 305830]|uniref:Uncharacterized protein n=1 Tax=Serendipita vermifera MAFF 305830 TaxID=933852 RepID=A0A0C2WC01_SERVB|nr:hypothetical protein M408DRAFT_332046 [Serendipita vermifera MAFF 305830]